ncbi:unnamed protein product [Heligmosomoides polygyrus]|uniref:CX domain-containing protein n=1 Tax=Heligmosomoides polygyrus TaxID=6339 RepID=A0A183G5N7_HELPZ|nr:unnamed protein product [Heligmosomoides polygyrus]
MSQKKSKTIRCSCIYKSNRNDSEHVAMWFVLLLCFAIASLVTAGTGVPTGIKLYDYSSSYYGYQYGQPSQNYWYSYGQPAQRYGYSGYYGYGSSGYWPYGYGNYYGYGTGTRQPYRYGSYYGQPYYSTSSQWGRYPGRYTSSCVGVECYFAEQTIGS